MFYIKSNPENERLRDIIPDTIKTVFYCKVSNTCVYFMRKLWALNRYALWKAGIRVNEATTEIFDISLVKDTTGFTLKEKG